MQENVEKPRVYLLARCPSTDLQLAYTGTRLEDIEGLREAIYVNDEIPIRDVMRFFKGILFKKSHN